MNFKFPRLFSRSEVAAPGSRSVALSRREPTIGLQRQRDGQRSFSAGLQDRLTSSFVGSHGPINTEIRQGLRLMRARSRDLFMNNDYGKKFIRLCQSNIIGVNGIRLQGRMKQRDGKKPDTLDNRELERAWADFGKPENCGINGAMSFHDIERLVVANLGVDGEALIQRIDTPKQGHGMKLRVLPAGYLDENNCRELPNGNVVIMGVEFDQQGQIINYHLRRNSLRAWANVYPEQDYIIIPAEQIIHIFITDHAEQARGIPWANTAIRRLNMIGLYEEAELVAAIEGSSKMGIVKSPTGDSANVQDFAPDDGGDEYADQGAERSIEAGTILQLSAGEEWIDHDPTHPTTAFDGFIRAVVRGAASGLNVAYAGLSGDLENVNFSSIRSGTLEERDQWRVLQNFVKTHFHQRVYDWWVPRSILNGELSLPMRNVGEKLDAIKWQPRGWAWVDPKKDSDANKQNLGIGTETRQNIIAQSGGDLEETFEQLQYEKERAAELGINVDQLDARVTLAEVQNDE